MKPTLFRLSVPARPTSLRVLRSVASAAAAEASLSYDNIEDMSLAIDEAGSALLAVSTGTMHCAGSVADSKLTLTVSLTPDGEIGDWPDPAWQQSLGGIVLSSIASDVEFTTDDEEPAIRFRVG